MHIKYFPVLFAEHVAYVTFILWLEIEEQRSKKRHTYETYDYSK